MYILIGIVDVH